MEPNFYELTGEDYIQEMRQRLYGELNLVWIKQCRRLLEPIMQQNTTILDVGCGVGYLYRYFQDLLPKYFGVDAESKFLEVAKNYYKSTPNVSFLQHNIYSSPVPEAFCPNADIAVCSATIEHLPSAFPALNHITASVSKAVYLRTFCGENTKLYSIPSPIKEYARQHRKNTNQYAFNELFHHFDELGFHAKAYRDDYTDSMPYLIDGTVRTFYVILAVRRSNK